MAIELKVSSSPLDSMVVSADKTNPGAASGADSGTPAPAGQFTALLTKFDQAAQVVAPEDSAAEDPTDAGLPSSPVSFGSSGNVPSVGETTTDVMGTGTVPLPMMDPLALMSQMQVAGQAPQQPQLQSQPQTQTQLPTLFQQQVQTTVQPQALVQPSSQMGAQMDAQMEAGLGEMPVSVEGTEPPALASHPVVKARADALGLTDVQKRASSGRFELLSGMEVVLPSDKKSPLAAKLTGAQLSSAASSSGSPLLQAAGDQMGGSVSSADFSEWLSGSLQKSVTSVKVDSTGIHAAGGSPAQSTGTTRTEMSPFGSWDFSSKLNIGAVDVQPPSGAAHASPEQQIADQVSVWVSQNVQSAELKMDAFGSDRVEVSITMAGKEATVQFRSDVAETRDLLQRAAANLESALRSDGLVLSGVSVGASTQGQDNAREASQNTHAFSKKPQSKQDATGDMGDAAIRMVARPAVAQGRLDLYV